MLVNFIAQIFLLIMHAYDSRSHGHLCMGRSNDIKWQNINDTKTKQALMDFIIYELNFIARKQMFLISNISLNGFESYGT